MRDDRQSGPQLAAYIVEDQPGKTGIEEIRTHLLARLPEYMVPARFFAINALPLTSTGKVYLITRKEGDVLEIDSFL